MCILGVDGLRSGVLAAMVALFSVRFPREAGSGFESNLRGRLVSIYRVASIVESRAGHQYALLSNPFKQPASAHLRYFAWTLGGPKRSRS